MAAKKNRNPARQTVQQNPFTPLKGFCVSPPPVSAASPVKPAQVAASEVAVPAAELFAREMDRLGVARSRQGGEDDGDSGLEEAGEELAAAAEKSDAELFLEGLGTMDALFADDVSTDEVTPAPPRRMKQVRQGRLRPEARLDLHGLGRAEALQKVGFFLQDAALQRRQAVLIITGRGNHNPQGEPVLRTAVEHYLRQAASAWVVEWGRAPLQYGGDGALVVFLKGCQR